MKATHPKACGTDGFNYCKCAKTLVAIPALPIVAWIAASFFQYPLVRVLAAIIAVTAVVKGAIWLDSLPLFQKKMCKAKDRPHE
jgi:hypothetical protein